MDLGIASPFNVGSFLYFILLIWSTFWKGIALWRAANYKQRNWFIVILVIQSIGILEVVYLFRFSKKRLTLKEIKSWFASPRP